MRYNDKELMSVGEGKADLEGILHHMKPQGNDWYQQSSFKERRFKLINNLLFYFRVNVAEQEQQQQPIGVLVLENARIAHERFHKGIPFAFSITFKVNDKDNEAKHIFSCRCDDDVYKWVSTLKIHSYEYWRSQFIILKTKISMKTGQDPVLDYMRNKSTKNNQPKTVAVAKVKCKEKKSTFYSHLETSSSVFTETTTTVTKTQEEENLIDL